MSQIILPDQLRALYHSPQTRKVRADDGTIFTARELEHIETQVMETEFQPMEAVNLVANDTSVPYWNETITYKTRRSGGEPIWVKGAPTEIPNVDQDVTEQSAKFGQLAIGASWTQKELDASRVLGLDLDTSGASDAVQALMTKMDEVTIKGDFAAGMKGFFDDENVPREESDVGFNSTFTTSQILLKLQDLVNGVSDNTETVEAASRLALSHRAYDYCANTPMSTDNSISILDQFLMNNSFITTREQVHRLAKLKTLTTGGIALGDVAVAYNLNPAKCKVNVVAPAPTGQILATPLAYVQIWTASISEVMWRKPKSASILTNIYRTS